MATYGTIPPLSERGGESKLPPTMVKKRNHSIWLIKHSPCEELGECPRLKLQKSGHCCKCPAGAICVVKQINGAG